MQKKATYDTEVTAAKSARGNQKETREKKTECVFAFIFVLR